MQKLMQVLIALMFVAYPFLVGWSLARGSFMAVSVMLIALGLLRLLVKSSAFLWPLSLFTVVCGAMSVLFNDHMWLKVYPVLTSLGAFAIFASTLWRPPSMIERFARIMQPDLPASGVQWTRRVTFVWCGFFILNAAISWWTSVYASTEIWVLYNGFISYVLMGILLIGEFILRKRHQRLQHNNE